MTYTISYIVSTFLLFMSLVYATPNRDPNPENYWIASENLLEFLAVFEGVYTNRAQLEAEKNNPGQHHVWVYFSLVPVEIPAFAKEERITFLLTEHANGAVYRTEVFEFIDEEDEVIRIKRYNLTGNSAPIEELRPEKLDTNPNCDGLFEKVESGVYVGTFSDCTLNQDGQSYPLYFETSTCSSLIVYPPAHEAETSNVLPYIFRKNESFPLPEYLFGPGDYSYAFVNPC